MSNQKQPQLTRTLEVIEKAKEKGFAYYEQVMSLRIFEPVMQDDSLFINVACATLSMWLRERGLYIAVAPMRGKFSFFVDGPGNKSGFKPHDFANIETWEDAWLTGIEEALKLL